MSTRRRVGSPASETRLKLLHAAEQLMREEGYAQVTSRKLAQHAGLKPQLVHYYFHTMDDLFEALFRSASEHQLARLDTVAASEDPLTGLFELSCDPSSAALQLEFLAMASHRKRLHGLIAEFGAELNRREGAILTRAMAARGIALPGFSAEQLATLLQTSARGLGFSGRFNTDRYESARAGVLAWLKSLGA